MRDMPLKLLDILIIAFSVIAVFIIILLFYNIAMAVPSLHLEQPSMSFEGGHFTIQTPFSVSNPGPFAISDVSYSIAVEDSAHSLVNITSIPITIPPGVSNYSNGFTVSFDFNQLSQSEFQRLISDFDMIKIQATVSGGMLPFISTTANATLILPWSPLMANFSIGLPEALPFNSTHINIGIPISFDNLSDLFPVNGNISVIIRDQFNRTYYVVLTVDAPSATRYSGSMLASVEMPPHSILTSFFFNDTLLTFNLSAQLHIFNFTLFPKDSKFQIIWGAPFKDPQFSVPTVVPFNSSHSTITFPFSFTNNNRFITLSGAANTSLFLGNMTIASSPSIPIFALPYSNFTSNVTLVVPNAALEISGLILKLELQTGYTTVYTEAQINA